MAKFCKNCGAPLEDGQVCACQQNSQQQNFQPQQQYSQYQGQPQAGAAAQQSGAGLYFKKMWYIIKGLVKTPATIGSKFVNSCDFKISFGLIGVQALAVALLMVSLAGKINSAMNSFGTTVPDGAKFPLFTIFLVGLIVTFGIACLLPAVLLMFTKMFKCNTTYKHMLCASGINSIMAAPFVLVGVLLSLVMPLGTISTSTLTNPASILAPFIWPLLISTIGVALGNFTTIKIIRSGSNLTDDKSVYVMFFSGIVLGIVLAIVYYIVFPMCLPPLVKTALDAAGGLSSLFG